jgi:hypothetical protein
MAKTTRNYFHLAGGLARRLSEAAGASQPRRRTRTDPAPAFGLRAGLGSVFMVSQTAT